MEKTENSKKEKNRKSKKQAKKEEKHKEKTEKKNNTDKKLVEKISVTESFVGCIKIFLVTSGYLTPLHSILTPTSSQCLIVI